MLSARRFSLEIPRRWTILEDSSPLVPLYPSSPKPRRPQLLYLESRQDFLSSKISLHTRQISFPSPPLFLCLPIITGVDLGEHTDVFRFPIQFWRAGARRGQPHHPISQKPKAARVLWGWHLAQAISWPLSSLRRHHEFLCRGMHLLFIYLFICLHVQLFSYLSICCLLLSLSFILMIFFRLTL